MKAILFTLLISLPVLAIENQELVTCNTTTGGRLILSNDDLQGHIISLEDENYNGIYTELGSEYSRFKILDRKNIYKVTFKDSTPLMGKERLYIKINKEKMTGKYTYKARCSFIFSPFCNRGKKVTVKKELINCVVK